MQETARGSEPPVMMQLERAEAADSAQTPVERGVTRVEVDLNVRWAIE